MTIAICTPVRLFSNKKKARALQSYTLQVVHNELLNFWPHKGVCEVIHEPARNDVCVSVRFRIGTKLRRGGIERIDSAVREKLHRSLIERYGVSFKPIAIYFTFT